MPYDKERFYIPESKEDIDRQLLEIINEREGTEDTVNQYIGKSRYTIDYPFIQIMYNTGFALAGLPDLLAQYIKEVNTTNLEATTTTTIGIETSLQKLVEEGLISDFSFGTFQQENSGLPAGYVGFALTLRNETEQAKQTIAKKLLEIVPATAKFYRDQAPAVYDITTPLGCGVVKVAWYNVIVVNVKVQIIAKFAGDNSLKLSDSEIKNTIVTNFDYSTTGIFVNRLKEGLNGFSQLHIRVSIDNGTTWINEDGIIPKDFKTKFLLQASNIEAVEEFK